MIVQPTKSKLETVKIHFGRDQIALLNIKVVLDFVDVST